MKQRDAIYPPTYCAAITRQPEVSPADPAELERLARQLADAAAADLSDQSRAWLTERLAHVARTYGRRR